MGFFGSGDKTNTTNQYDQRVAQAVSDQGVLASGSGQIGGGLNTSTSGISGGSEVVGIGAHQARASTVNEGSGLIARDNVTQNIENVDKDVISAYGGTLKDVLETQASADSIRDVAQQNFLTGISQSLARLTGAQQGIDANAASGGDIQRNRIVLYVVLGVLALLGLIYWKSK